MRFFLIAIMTLIIGISLVPFTGLFSADDGIVAIQMLEKEDKLGFVPDGGRNDIRNKETYMSSSHFEAPGTYRTENLDELSEKMEKFVSKELKMVDKSKVASNEERWREARRVQATTSLHTCQLHNETVTIPTVPYFVIIGAQKSGTTSIARYLGEHPDILPQLHPRRKEVHFFNNVFQGLIANHWVLNKHNDTLPEFWCRSRKRYVETMYQLDIFLRTINETGGSTNLVSFDKTPSYIHLDNCPEFLKRTCPWMKKIIVVLRDPVDRAYSQHQMDSMRKEKRSFEQRIRDEIKKARLTGLHDFPDMPDSLEEIQKIEEMPNLNRTSEQEYESFRQLIGYPMLKKGLYAIQLRKWFAYFNFPDEILVLKYEEFQKDPATAYNRVLGFVGLRNHTLKTYEKHLAGRYEPMPENCRRYLEKFFRAYNDQLADLLGEEWRNVWTN